MDLVHWSALLGLLSLFCSIVVFKRTIDRHNELLEDMKDYIDRCRMFREAVVLLEYGARDEALALLHKVLDGADKA